MDCCCRSCSSSSAICSRAATLSPCRQRQSSPRGGRSSSRAKTWGGAGFRCALAGTRAAAVLFCRLHERPYMRALSAFLASAAVALLCVSTAVAAEAPRLVEHDGHYALMVDGKPFFVLGGQINN